MMIPGKDGQMQEQIDFSKTTELCCEKCGHVNKEFADVAGIQ
jgi:hypothetical protein